MFKGLEVVEKLIQDLERDELLLDYVLSETVIRVDTTEILLLIYLPNSVRIEDELHKKTVHLDIDILNNSYKKVLQRLRGLFGKGERLYARHTVVARVDKQVVSEFLDEYHLNMPLKGKYRYGLFHDGELVSVAVFSGGRIMREIHEEFRSFELLRFCHKADYLVIGGISKLLKAFIKDFKPNDIMTYSDRDWSQGVSLQKIGFVSEGTTEPNHFYIKNGKRLTYLDNKEKYDYIVTNRGSFKMKLYL
ncbi:hypothetical protein [Sphingobacterium composti Ten et al. 2007 non Yoo et al. 2007]|uniref:hypothetical protein n=1 Tax=Sphingobacterium composti TaxID=363260 RepID=UPI001357FB87|nr:hypothetical protein [Sphingobacterium composti Ten et al. 2007 non Yoo et al. 2007]